MNCGNNLLSNRIPLDPKKITHFIDRKKTMHRVQQVAWQSVTEPGIFRPAPMTFLLNSMPLWLGWGALALLDMTNLSLWVTEPTHQPLTLSHELRWTQDLRRKQSCPVEQVCPGIPQESTSPGKSLKEGQDGATTETSCQIHSPLSQECQKDNT